MGQYYKPVNTKTMEWLYSHDYDDLLKLMEHSWIGNYFVGAVMHLLKPKGKWFKNPVVWCGDYYSDKGETPYYKMVKYNERLKNILFMKEKEQLKSVLVNYTKKEYVILNKMKKNKNGWRINPLPLLTALGNGRGGGDYHDKSPDFDKVGIWANDKLGVLKSIPKGFVELEVNFIED